MMDDVIAVYIARQNGWWLIGHKSEECYWWNGEAKILIDWDKPLLNQIP